MAFPDGETIVGETNLVAALERTVFTVSAVTPIEGMFHPARLPVDCEAKA
jgi:hypothetical protein